jgi:hypothetical protein
MPTPLPAYIWADHNGRPHPFVQDENTRRLMCFDVEGTVVDYFLKSDAKYGHYITVRLSPEDVLLIKNIIHGAPNHSDFFFNGLLLIISLNSNQNPTLYNLPLNSVQYWMLERSTTLKTITATSKLCHWMTCVKTRESASNIHWHPIKEERNLSQVLLIYIRLLRSKWKDRFYTTTPPVPVKEPDFTSHSIYTL